MFMLLLMEMILLGKMHCLQIHKRLSKEVHLVFQGIYIKMHVYL